MGVLEFPPQIVLALDHTMSKDMQSYFEQSAAVTRRVVEHLDRTYAKPTTTYTIQSFENRPIYTTFAVIFALLSSIPVLSFISFSLFVFGTFLSIALCGALIASLLVILIAGGLLASTLLIILFLTAFLTTCTVTCFLFVRLALLIRARGASDGAVQWTEEVRGRWRGSSDAGREQGIELEQSQPVHEKDESDSGSTIIVVGEPEDALDKAHSSVKLEE